MFSVVGSSVEETSEFYNKWNEEVKKTVPANRLLVKSGFKFAICSNKLPRLRLL